MNNICVFDLETDSVNTDLCCPTQVACLMINPYKLEIIPGSEFYSKIRPFDIDSKDYLQTANRKGTIQFHCKNRNISEEELLEEWRNSPPIDIVWRDFESHINKYNQTKTDFGAPWAAGINIINFDLPIVRRINAKFKVKRMFGHEIMDLRHLLLYWLVWDSGLRSRSMDNIRKYMSMSSENSHDALKDVKDETAVLLKFLRLHKELYPKVRFKNCFANEVCAY